MAHFQLALSYALVVKYKWINKQMRGQCEFIVEYTMLYVLYWYICIDFASFSFTQHKLFALSIPTC